MKVKGSWYCDGPGEGGRPVHGSAVLLASSRTRFSARRGHGHRWAIQSKTIEYTNDCLSFGDFHALLNWDELRFAVVLYFVPSFSPLFGMFYL